MPIRFANSDRIKALFCETYKYLQQINPRFAPSGKYSRYPHRFKATTHAVNPSTTALVANGMPWAKHRNRKAAAKMQMRLNLQILLPSFAIAEEASHHDDTGAVGLWSEPKSGEIAVMEKA